MVLMDLTKAPNVKGYEKRIADEMLFFFSLGFLFFSSILFVFPLLFIFYLARCFKPRDRKGDQENSEFCENRLKR